MKEIVSEYECKAILSIQAFLSNVKNPCLCFSGGKNSLVLLHLVQQLAPGSVTIIHVDTGAEFPAVRSYIQKMKKLWKLNLIIEISGVNKGKGENKEACCTQYLFTPLKNIIKSRKFDGVLIGETSGSTMDISNFLVSDENSAIALAQPLISFTSHDIWEYIRSHNLPFCSLYENGFSKIDCEPCSFLDTSPGNESASHDDEALIKEKLKKLGYL
jgi:phosphoadenosine phosphosulfate reductase